MKPFAALVAILPMILLAGCGAQRPSPATGTLEVRVTVIIAPSGGFHVQPPTPQVAVAYPVMITRTLRNGPPSTLTVKTNESGSARFVLLQPGRYALQVDSPNPLTNAITSSTGPGSASVQAGGVTSIQVVVDSSCPICE